jgi:molybdopterin synthase catalytic subunit
MSGSAGSRPGDGPAAREPGGGAAPDGTTIRVRVRLFARLREIAGARVVDLEIASGATVEDAWAALAAGTPAFDGLRDFVRFAVDGAYADATTRLVDGSEIACIPPVSGGSGDDEGAGPGGATDGGRRVLAVTETPFAASILADLAARVATDEDGAVVGFLGRTRATPGTPAPGEEVEAARHAGRRVHALEYEAFEPLALRVLGEVADEVAARFGVAGLAIVHRTGRVPLGEPSIAIVAAAPHRGDAFAAASYAIDETKARAPIWKAEMFADGHVWVGAPARTGPTRVDTAARATDPAGGTRSVADPARGETTEGDRMGDAGDGGAPEEQG